MSSSSIHFPNRDTSVPPCRIPVTSRPPADSRDDAPRTSPSPSNTDNGSGSPSHRDENGDPSDLESRNSSPIQSNLDQRVREGDGGEADEEEIVVAEVRRENVSQASTGKERQTRSERGENLDKAPKGKMIYCLYLVREIFFLCFFV